MTFIDEFKARATFYPKGRIVPQRIAKGHRKTKHLVTFGSDTWFMYSPQGWILFCDTKNEYSLIRLHYAHKKTCKNVLFKGLKFVGTGFFEETKVAEILKRVYEDSSHV